MPKTFAGSTLEAVAIPANLSTSERSMTSDSMPAQQILIAGAGYAGLHVALRLTALLDRNDMSTVKLVDQHDYHQVLTELPRVAAGTRASEDVRLPLTGILENRVEFVLAQVTGSTCWAISFSRIGDLCPIRAWSWRSAVGPTISRFLASLSAPCHCTPFTMPSEYAHQSQPHFARPPWSLIPNGNGVSRRRWLGVVVQRAWS